MKELKTNYLVRFTRKTGKIDTTIEGLGEGLLSLWALQNTTKTKDTIIFDEDGIVVAYYEGTATGFPKVTEGDGVEHIDKYCKGLLEAVKEA